MGPTWSGFIPADQVFAFPSRELDERIGVLAAARLADVDQTLRFVLEL
jgi:mRNA-degrading endonuclease toxin of MazEF toxin-antitoxin module